MNAELYELVEKHLQGNLTNDEKIKLEYQLNNNPAFAKELEDYLLLQKSFKIYKKRNSLLTQMDSIHAEMKKAGMVPAKSRVYKMQVLGKKFFPTIAVAASVAIFTVLSTFYIRTYIQSLENKQTLNYIELSNKIEDTKNKIKEVVSDKSLIIERQASSIATGFVIASNGYLVTNYHVTKNADSVYIESMTDHKRFKVEVVHSDQRLDLSILKITDKDFKTFGRLPYNILNKESDLGESVYTLAYPRSNMGMIFGEGSISAKSDWVGDTVKYQVSIPVNPGNSGSPVFDSNGNLVGIVSRKYTDAEVATAAVKSEYLHSVIDSVNCKEPSQKLQLMSQKNLLKFYSRPQQIKQIQPFVFSVKVYEKGK